MTYEKKEEKEQIQIAFKVLLAQHGLTLKKFCRKHELKYSLVYERLMRLHINHDYIDELVHKLDKKKFLQMWNGKLVIQPKF